MKEELIRQLPLIVASVSLIAGFFLGRWLAMYEKVARLWPGALALLALSFFFGNRFVAFSGSWLSGLTGPLIASYVSVALLSFLGGTAYALFYLGSKKKQTDNKED
jgi:hypothetical protein